MSKKNEPVRLYNFPDSVLISKCNTIKVTLQRDIAELATYGINTAKISAWETKINAFENFPTDDELLGEQSIATQAKDEKAETIRVALRELMQRAASKYGLETPRYKKFGVGNIVHLSDAELLHTARKAARVATSSLPDLTEKGLTTAIITALSTMANEFEILLHTKDMKTADRDIFQEDRVEMGNTLYNLLIDYCENGRTAWETKDVAKYNDYIIYNTSDGEPTIEPV